MNGVGLGIVDFLVVGFFDRGVGTSGLAKDQQKAYMCVCVCACVCRTVIKFKS